MINGTPHWTAPRWLDPDQTPRRNTAHHADLEFRAPKPRPEADPPPEAEPPPDGEASPEADPPPDGEASPDGEPPIHSDP
jgi:hypothetical protein